MTSLPSDKLEDLIAKCLNDFYERRFARLNKLQLKQILKRKNPYLFRAIGTERASEIVSQIRQAYLSSSDETIFGDAYFEQIARNLPNVQVSDAKGVDLIVNEKKSIRAYAVKSGPNPFNASAKVRQNTEFQELRSRLLKSQKIFDPVLAYSYGNRVGPPDKDRIYRETSGQEFWKELTGDDDFYLKLIRLMKDIPLKRKLEYRKIWDASINRFEREFIEEFCFDNGGINWEKLTQFVSKSS